jgi:hypothetical protein
MVSMGIEGYLWEYGGNIDGFWENLLEMIAGRNRKCSRKHESCIRGEDLNGKNLEILKTCFRLEGFSDNLRTKDTNRQTIQTDNSADRWTKSSRQTVGQSTTPLFHLNSPFPPETTHFSPVSLKHRLTRQDTIPSKLPTSFRQKWTLNVT